MICRILKEDLKLKSVNDRNVPYQLTPATKERRVACCREAMKAFSTRSIMKRLVHIDEKWFYARPIGNPSTRTSWVAPDGDVPTTHRRSTMESKFMAIVATNFEGLTFYKVLPRKRTMDSIVYCAFLEEVFASFSTYKLWTSRKAILWENAVILHDNARPHVSKVTNDFSSHRRPIPWIQIF